MFKRPDCVLSIVTNETKYFHIQRKYCFDLEAILNYYTRNNVARLLLLLLLYSLSDFIFHVTRLIKRFQNYFVIMTPPLHNEKCS